MKNELVFSSVPNTAIHVHYMQSPTQTDTMCEIHIHDEFEFLAVKKGRVDFYVHNVKHEMYAGDVIFVNSRVPHYTHVYKYTQDCLIQFGSDINNNSSDFHISKFLSRFFNYGNADIFIFKNGTSICEVIKKNMYDIVNEYTNKDTSFDLFIKSFAFNILGTLYRNKILYVPSSLADNKTIAKINPVLDYIELHYNEQISLEALSSIVHLNEYYFCRLFKKATHTTFTQYINFIRICKAEKMLISSDKSISEISFETGFSSVSYFNRTFKKFKYCTPSLYKQIKFSQQ